MREVKLVKAIFIVFTILSVSISYAIKTSERFKTTLKEGLYGILSYDNDILSEELIFIPVFIVDEKGYLVDPYLKGVSFLNNKYKRNHWKIVRGKKPLGKLYNVVFKSYSYKIDDYLSELKSREAYDKLKACLSDSIRGYIRKLNLLEKNNDIKGVEWIIPINSAATFELPKIISGTKISNNVSAFLQKEISNLNVRSVNLYENYLSLYKLKLGNQEKLVFCYGDVLKQCYLKDEADKTIIKITEREPIPLEGNIYPIALVDLDNDGINEFIFEERLYISTAFSILNYKIYKYNPYTKSFRLIYRTKCIPEWSP